MRYGLGVLLVIFLVIVGAVVLFDGDNSSSSKQLRNTQIVDYENKDRASVSWTQQGVLVGEDQRRSIRVIVTRNNRMVEVLDGYEQRVEKSQQYTNTPAAFSAFVRALDDASFGLERDVSEPDERGMCPTGNIFIYRLTDVGTEIMRTWSGNCSRAGGSFGGSTKNASLIARLFKAQITGYSDFVSGVKL